jgi:glycosyltransferase involved in cell wall biosynthesis
MSNLRIAIAVSTRHAYSETFIAAHEQRLKEVVAILSDGMPPCRVDDVPLLLPTTPKARLRSFIERKFHRLDQVTRRHRRTVELLRDRRVDVVLAEYGVMGEAMVSACHDAGVPLVAHFHGHDAHKHQVVADHNGYKRLIAGAAALVVVSRSMEQRLIALGAPRDKVHYNCYGIDVQRFAAGRPASAPPHFTAIGRFVDKKAPHLTLVAFRKALDVRPDARLTMVGAGPLLESCKQLAAALHMTQEVTFAGIQPPEQVAELLRHSRAFVQHSVVTTDGDSEGTPLAVLEAMACGLPVVATRHAGISDVVEHEQRGLLCAERDVEGMGANLVRLAEDTSLAAHYGANGRAYVLAHHRVEDRIAGLEGILAQAARGLSIN